MSSSLSISIVVYSPDSVQLGETCVSLLSSLRHADFQSFDLVLVDNGPGDNGRMLRNLASDLGVESMIVSGHGNVGYGRGHNLAITIVQSDYHLVLNPDVVLAPEAIGEALAFMAAHPDCGLLSPLAHGPSGERQYLCKRYPDPLTLALRGFGPKWLRRLLRARLDRYEMRDQPADAVMWDPPIVSGCFMLFRTSVLKQVGGFDERYFLYFEDFDLSLRTAEVARLAFVPAVKIVHAGGNASRKGWQHIKMFVRSAITFFNSHARKPAPGQKQL